MHIPFVSVIVPVYKAENFIEECVKSVLQQTFTNFELILVDDGSPDNSGYVCDNLAYTDRRIRVLHKTNGGVSDARNLGMKEALGQYFSFLDADDRWMPNYLEKVVEGFKRFPETKMCACARWNVTGGEVVSQVSLKGDGNEYLKISNLVKGIYLVITSGITISSDLPGVVGGFKVGAKRGEDLDFWIRISANHDIVYYNIPIFYYRMDSPYNSRTTLIGEEFPYWEWYGYPHRFKRHLSLFTTRLLLHYVRRCFAERRVKMALFYLRRIRWWIGFFST